MSVRRIRSALVMGDILTDPIVGAQEGSFRIKQAQGIARSGVAVTAVSPFGRHVGSMLRDFLVNLFPSHETIDGVYCLFPPTIRIPSIGSVLSLVPSTIFLLIMKLFLRVDLIYATGVQHGAIAVLLNRWYRAKIVVNYGDPEFARVHGLKSTLLSILETIAFRTRAIAAGIYLDPEVNAHLQEISPGLKTVFLPPAGFDAGVPPAKIDPKFVQSIKLRLGLENMVVVTYAGQVFDRPYRLDLLPKAAQKVVSRTPNARFLIVGAGPYLNKLILEVKRLSLGAYFLFEGAVSHEEVPSYLSFSHVGLQLLDDMCMGTKVLNYMLNGVPVISTGKWYRGYAHDRGALLHDGDNCILIPPDPVKLADAIQQVLTDAGLREKLLRSAFQEARMYSWEHHGEVILRCAL